MKSYTLLLLLILGCGQQKSAPEVVTPPAADTGCSTPYWDNEHVVAPTALTCGVCQGIVCQDCVESGGALKTTCQPVAQPFVCDCPA